MNQPQKEPVYLKCIIDPVIQGLLDEQKKSKKTKPKKSGKETEEEKEQTSAYFFKHEE